MTSSSRLVTQETGLMEHEVSFLTNSPHIVRSATVFGNKLAT